MIAISLAVLSAIAIVVIMIVIEVARRRRIARRLTYEAYKESL